PLFRCLGEEHRNRRATSPNRFLASVHLATRSRGASAPPNPEPARTFFAEQLQRRARPGAALVALAFRAQHQVRGRQPVAAVESLPARAGGGIEKMLAPVRPFSVSIRP